MTAIILGVIAVAGTLGTAAYQYRAERQRTAVDADLGRETLIDARINAHLNRLDAEVEDLRKRNIELALQIKTLAAQLDAAIAYIRLNELPWPPEHDGWPMPPPEWFEPDGT